MKLAEVQQILRAEVLVGADKLDREIEAAFSADLISDMLAMCRAQALLLTGVTHVQVVKTAEICDLVAIVFVRGKRPGPETIALAQEKGMPLLLCYLTMYESSGLLFHAGLPGNSRDPGACGRAGGERTEQR